VVTAALYSVFSGLLMLALLGATALYAGLVFVNYRTAGPQGFPHLDWHDPAHAAEHLAVWLGVRILALAVWIGTPIFAMLSEASADVGEWFLAHTREARSEK